MPHKCFPGPLHSLVALSMKICRTLLVVHVGTAISS